MSKRKREIMGTIKAIVWIFRTQYVPRVKMLGLFRLDTYKECWTMFKGQSKLPKKYQRWGL